MRPGALTIEEGGAEQLYTVVLLTQPTGTVRVQVSPVAPDPLPEDPLRLRWSSHGSIESTCHADPVDLHSGQLELSADREGERSGGPD